MALLGVFEYSLAYDTESSDWTVSQLSVAVANTRDRRAKRDALSWLMVPEIVRLGLVAFGPEVRQLHGGESMAEACSPPGSKGANRQRKEWLKPQYDLQGHDTNN